MSHCMQLGAYSLITHNSCYYMQKNNLKKNYYMQMHNIIYAYLYDKKIEKKKNLW